MFIGAFAVELFGLWRRIRDYQRAAHVILVVGALGAIAAAFLGWFADGFYLWDRNPILMTHRWLGTLIVVFGDRPRLPGHNAPQTARPATHGVLGVARFDDAGDIGTRVPRVHLHAWRPQPSGVLMGET